MTATTINVTDAAGKKTGSVELPAELFDVGDVVRGGGR